MVDELKACLVIAGLSFVTTVSANRMNLLSRIFSATEPRSLSGFVTALGSLLRLNVMPLTARDIPFLIFKYLAPIIRSGEVMVVSEGCQSGSDAASGGNSVSRWCAMRVLRAVRDASVFVAGCLEYPTGNRGADGGRKA